MIEFKKSMKGGVAAALAGAAQVVTATVAGAITTSGDALITVTGALISGSPLEVPVALTAGVPQVVTATVVVGTVVSTGDVAVTVTGAGITGSPLAVPVAVEADDDAAVVAGKIRTELNGISAITDLYTVGGSGADVTLTRIAPPVANDATLNIATAGGTAGGLDAAPISANTTAGVAPDDAASVATKIRAELNSTAAITTFYTVGGSGVYVSLTKKAPFTNNDDTLNIAIADDTCEGLTAALESAGTHNGVAAVSAFTAPVILPTFTVALLPPAADWPRGAVYVSNGTGNKRQAISDGANWRFPDGNVVS